jgi:RNA polymerase sigma factor (sigma-70 family)
MAMTKPSKHQKGLPVSGIYRAFLDNESAIKGFLRRLLYKQEDIDEIAQETFLRAYRATQGRDIDSPRAYIFRVARRLAFDELSRNTRKFTDYLAEVDDYGESGSDTLEDEMEGQQQIRLYFDAISSLSPECRQVFLMRKVQGLPYKAIAKKLGITTKTVEYHLTMGAVRCKDYIKNKNQQDVEEKGASSSAKLKSKGQRHES